MTTSPVWFILLLFRFVGPTPLQPYSLRHGTGGFAVSEFIKRYEPCVFDQEATLRQHKRIRRSLGNHPPPPLHIHLKTNQRDFRLKLYPDRDVFSDDVTFETGSGKTIPFDPGKAYVGTLQDEEENSSVRGVVTEEGLFDGTITTSGDEYYVEPLRRYSEANVSAGFHSIVYRLRDVARPRSPRTCRSALLHASPRRQPFPSPSSDSSLYYLDRDTYEIRRANKTDIIVKKKAPFMDDDPRLKRTTSATIDQNKTTCMLYLQADHLFYQKYATEEACIEVMTRHVQRVNAIYKNTDFDQDGRPDNIGFMIKRIKVHTTESLNDQSYRFPGNYGVEKFLELFSEEDYDAFCLAYMFTYRDFEMGTLGLAWTGDLKNAGGVCEKNGHYRGSMKSLNTGIVTLLNYGKHVPPAVSHVTLAHEIGHNFGSPHDPDQCTPGGEDGNFIMFARATSGDKKNNNKFSPCSLASINPVLNSKARSVKGCFTEPQGAICGNGVVEKGEQCDCGWEEDCKEDCCYPQRRHPPPDQPPCHLTPHSTCSPSQGPCCTALCSLKFGDKCRDDNGCRDSSYCDGKGPHCPPSINKPNKTICNEEFVCFMGECTGSICLAYGLESCQCIPSTHDPPTKACELCCKLSGENKPCMSSFYWNTTSYEMPILFSKPGTPCNDYNGYCDVFQKCREVDPSGPLATLRKLLLSEESIASFKRWVMDRWYYALLIVASVILILVLSTRLLGKTTDLKLKAITIIHSSTTETVRLPADGEGNNTVVVHPGVSSKLPLKKKVRGGAGATKRRMGVARPSHQTEVTKHKKSSRKKNNKKNEIIDYSRTQEKPSSKTPDEDPLGKVRNWLLNSHIDRTIVRKSKSSPAGFLPTSTSTVEQRVVVPASRPMGMRGDDEEEERRHRRRTATSAGAGVATSVPKRTPSSSKEQVKLQVMYKPPFKFSVKLKKPAQVATSVVKEINSKVRRPRTAMLVRQHKRNQKRKSNAPNEARKEKENGAGTTALNGDQNGNPEIATATLATPIVARLISVEQLPKEPLYQNTGEAVQDLLRMSSVDVQSTKQQPLLEEPHPVTDTIPSDLEVLLSESEYLFSNDT